MIKKIIVQITMFNDHIFLFIESSIHKIFMSVVVLICHILSETSCDSNRRV